MKVRKQDWGRRIGTHLFSINYARPVNWIPKTAYIAYAQRKDHEESADWYGYVFWANMGYSNTEENEYREWAASFGRAESTLNELMQSENGRELWEKNGFTWIGRFDLEPDNPCNEYLKLYLERRGIDIAP